MKVSFRQGIVRHQTDIAGTQTFLQASGNRVTLNVSPDPTIITIAHENTNYLFTERSTVINAWGPFTAGTDYWLYWDIDLITGVRTFGHTTLIPVTSASAPSSPATNKHWFDTVNKVMKVWNGVKWVPKVRVFAAKYQSASTFVKMSGVGGSTFTGSQAGLNGSIRAGSLIFDNAGKPIKRGDGKFFTTEDAFVTGVPTGNVIKLESILIPAESQQNLSAYTIVKFTDFNEIVAGDAATADSVPFGIIEEDAVVGDIVNVTMEGLVTNPDWDWEEINAQVFCDEDGVVVDEVITPGQLPVGVVVDRTTILLRAPQLLLDSGADAIPNADNTVKGVTKLSVAPASSTNPIAVGDNDPRVQNVAHSGANTDITSVLLNQTGLVVKGATAVPLTIKPNETLTSPRTLNIITGDADRTLTLTGNASVAGTHSGTSSGTNTGDQNTFLTIAVSGQNNVVADSATDTLTLAAGAKIAITTNDTTDTITIATVGAAASGANTDITSILLNQTGLVVKGGDSNALTIRPNETLTAARTLNLITGDANRTLTLSGDATISGTHSGTSSGTNTGDQVIPYDIAASVFGTPGDGAVIMRFVAVRNVTLNAHTNPAPPRAKADVAATGLSTFTIEKNGSSVGTFAFSASGTVASFTFAGTSLVPGDVLTITAPGTADGTLADIQITLSGSVA